MHIDLTRPETLSGRLARVRNNNILIRVRDRQGREQADDSLIVLPDIDRKGTSEELDRIPMFADVLMVGPDVRGVFEGDVVITTELAGDPIWIEGQEHRIVREPAVMAVVEERGKSTRAQEASLEAFRNSLDMVE